MCETTSGRVRELAGKDRSNSYGGLPFSTKAGAGALGIAPTNTKGLLFRSHKGKAVQRCIHKIFGIRLQFHAAAVKVHLD